jgi:hypothetical protein
LKGGEDCSFYSSDGIFLQQSETCCFIEIPHAVQPVKVRQDFSITAEHAGDMHN